MVNKNTNTKLYTRILHTHTYSDDMFIFFLQFEYEQCNMFVLEIVDCNLKKKRFSRLIIKKTSFKGLKVNT